ncbi:uncharacterized protein HKW66_Vig0112600 [Vigna angularis]|uniref:Uncharacterized protein n=1 Tax=Phaseolus angularis TaxID=3914 RepID=A0A8T0KZN4_PHAAN|nr:uncharacterized protein HKW66_Vig0112600 [Vigna angularis]
MVAVLIVVGVVYGYIGVLLKFKASTSNDFRSKTIPAASHKFEFYDPKTPIYTSPGSYHQLRLTNVGIDSPSNMEELQNVAAKLPTEKWLDLACKSEGRSLLALALSPFISDGKGSLSKSTELNDAKAMTQIKVLEARQGQPCLPMLSKTPKVLGSKPKLLLHSH